METEITSQGPQASRVVRGLLILAAVMFLIGALYYYLVPAQVASNEGVFGCGTAAQPPTDGFAKGACQGTATINLYKALVLLGFGVAAGLAQFFIFLSPRPDDEDDVDLRDPEEEPDRLDPARERSGRRRAAGDRDRRARSRRELGDDWSSSDDRGRRRAASGDDLAEDWDDDEPPRRSGRRGRSRTPGDDWDSQERRGRDREVLFADEPQDDHTESRPERRRGR